jgi:hypothetical protein
MGMALASSLLVIVFQIHVVDFALRAVEAKRQTPVAGDAHCLVLTAICPEPAVYARPQFDTSSLLPQLFLADAMSFWQHALVKDAGYQDAPRFDPIKHHMPGMFHAAQAGPDMIAGTA